MIIYRPQRGTLEESMNQAIEFENEYEMKQHIVRDFKGFVSEDDILLSDEVIEDDRVNWRDTRKVFISRYGDQVYTNHQAIGFYATKY